MKKLSLLSKVLLFTILFGLCFTAKSSFAVTNNTPIKTLEVKKNVVEIPVQSIDVDKQITSEYNLTLKAGEPVSVVFTQNDKILQDWFWNWYTSKGTEGYATTVRNLLVGLKQTPKGESKQYTVKNIFGTKGAIVNIIVEEPDMFVAGAEGSLKKLNNYTKYSNRDVKYLDVNGDGLITSYDIKYLNELFVKYDSDYDYVVNNEIDKADKDKVEAAIKNTKGIGKTNVIYPEQELKLQVIDDKVEEGRTWGLESVDVRKLQYQITYKDGSKFVDVTEYFSLKESKENTSIAILSIDSKNVTKNRVPNDKVLTLTFRKKPYGAPEGLCKETDSEIESQKIAEFNFKIENRVVTATGCDLYLDVDSQGLSEKTALLKKFNGVVSNLKVWNEATKSYETTGEKYVVVPRTVTYNGVEYKIRGICKDAFDKNATINYIVLGNWIDEIQDGAFDGMTALKGIELLTDTEAVINKYDPDGLYVGHYSKNTKYTSMDGVLYELAEDGSLSTLVKYPVAKPNTEYTLLKCNTIGYGAFKDAKKLEKVIFNTSVYSIHDEAFYGCTNLSGIELFNVYEIGEKAFYNVGKEVGTVREDVSEEVSGEESEEKSKIIPTITIDSIGLQTIGKTLNKYPEQIMSDELELASYVNVTDNALTGSDVFYGVPNVGYYSDNYAMDLYIRAKGDNDFKNNPEFSERYILLDADEEVEAEDSENKATEDGAYDIVGNKVIVNPTNGEYNINVDETTTKLIRDVAEGDVISLKYLRNSGFEKAMNRIKDLFKNDSKYDGTIEENLYHWALTNVDFLPLDSDDKIVKDKEIKKNKAEGENTTYTADENGWYNAFKDSTSAGNKALFDMESFSDLKSKFGKIQDDLENSPIFLKTQNEVANNQKSFTSWIKGIGQKEKCIQQNSAVIKNIFNADESIEKIIVKANLRNCLFDQYETIILKKFKPVIYIEILREDVEDPNNYGKITIDPTYSNNLWNISSDVEVNGNVISISASTFDGIKKEYSKTGFVETTDLKFVLQNKNGSINMATNWSYELKSEDTYIKNVPVTLNKDNVGGVTVSIPDISEYGYEKLDLTLIATAVGQDYIYKFNITIYSRQQTIDGATYYLKTLAKEDSNLNEAVFTKFTGEGNDLTIPSMLSVYPESEGLVENVKVVELASESIYNCPNLTNIKFELNVKELPEKLISGCPNLASITIPKTVEKIDPRFVWNDCISLSEYNVEEGNAYFTSEDGILYNKDKTELLLYPFAAGTIGETLTIPETVKTIGKYAFAYNNNLSNIYLPDYITCVKPFAFAYIKNLKDVVLSSAIDCIGGMDKGMRDKISISGVLSGSLKSEYENGNVGNIFAGYGENYKNIKVYYDKNNEQLLQYACIFGNVDYTDKDKYERKRDIAYLSKLPEADFVRLEISDIYFEANPIEQTYYAGEKFDMSVLPETITVEYNEVNEMNILQVVPVTSNMLKYIDTTKGKDDPARYVTFDKLTFSEDIVELSERNGGKLDIVLCYENANTKVVTANIIPAVLDIDESGIKKTSFINDKECIDNLKDIIKVYPLNSNDGRRATNDEGKEIELGYVSPEELAKLSDVEKEKTYSIEVREDEKTGEKYVRVSRNGGLPGYGQIKTPIKIYSDDELVSFKINNENDLKILEEEIPDYILSKENNIIYLTKEDLSKIPSLYVEIAKVPTKQTYTIGLAIDKDVDLTGMQLKVNYRHFDEYGNSAPIVLDTINLASPETYDVWVETSKIEELMILSEKYGSINEEQIELCPVYNGINTINTFKINVLPGILEKISVKSNPIQLEYSVGEIFNPEGLVIEGTFNINGEEVTGIISEGYTLTSKNNKSLEKNYDEEGNTIYPELDSNDEGPITVSFKATETNTKKATTTDINIVESGKKIVGIYIEKDENFKPEYNKYDKLEMTEAEEIKVYGIKEDGSEELLTQDKYTVLGDGLYIDEETGDKYFDKFGKNIITVAYNKNKNYYENFEVNVVVPEIERIEILTAPKYYYNFSAKEQEFDLINSSKESARIKIVYKDETYVNPKLNSNEITFEDAINMDESFGKLIMPVIPASTPSGTENTVTATYKRVSQDVAGNTKEETIKTEKFGYKIIDEIVLEDLVQYTISDEEEYAVLKEEISDYIFYEEESSSARKVYIRKEDLPKITSLYVEIAKNPNKENYTLGLAIDKDVDLSGMQLKVNYKHFDKNGEFKPIELKTIEVRDSEEIWLDNYNVKELMQEADKFGSVNEEQLVLCPKYNGIETVNTFEINVLPGILQKINVKLDPSQLEYEAGEIFNAEGLVLEGTFNVDGKEVTGVISKGFTLTAKNGKDLTNIVYDKDGNAVEPKLDKNDEGSITITFKSTDNNVKTTTTSELSILEENENRIVGIIVEKVEGFSTDKYKFDEAEADKLAIKVYGKQKDGTKTEDELAESEYSILGDGLFECETTGKKHFMKSGKNILKVVYNKNRNYYEEIEINVIAPIIEKIEVITAPRYYYYYSEKDQEFSLINSSSEQAKLRIVYRDYEYVNPIIYAMNLGTALENVPNVMTFEDAMKMSEDFGKIVMPVIKGGTKIGTEEKVTARYDYVTENIDGNIEKQEIPTESFGYKVVEEIIAIDEVVLNKEKYLMSNNEEGHIGVDEVDWTGYINVRYRAGGKAKIALESKDVVKQFVSVNTDDATGIRTTEWKLYILAQGVNPKDYKTITVFTYEYPLTNVQKIEITKSLEDTSYDLEDIMSLSEGEVTVTYAYAAKGVKKKVYLTTEDILKMNDSRLNVVLVNNAKKADKDESLNRVDVANSGKFSTNIEGYYTAYIVIEANRTHGNSVEKEATSTIFPVTISKEHYEVFINATLDDEKWDEEENTIYYEGQKASDNVYAIEMSNGSKYAFLCSGIVIPSSKEETQNYQGYKLQSQEAADKQAKIIKDDFIYEPEVLGKDDTSFTITYKYDTRLTTTINNIKVVSKEVEEVNFLENNMSKQQYFGDIDWDDSEIEVVYNYKDANSLNISDLNEVRYFKVSDLIENGQIEVSGTPVDFNLEEKAYEIKLKYIDADTQETKEVFVKQRVEEKVEKNKIVRYTSNLNSIGNSTADEYTNMINSIGNYRFDLTDFDINNEKTYKDKISNVELSNFILDLDSEIDGRWVKDTNFAILDRVYDLNENKEIKYPLYNYEIEETSEREKTEEVSVIVPCYNRVPVTFNFMEEIKDMEISLLPGTKYLKGSLLQLNTGLVKITYKREGVEPTVVTMSDERLGYVRLDESGVQNGLAVNCEMELNGVMIGLKSFQSSKNSEPYNYIGNYNEENKGLYGKWFVTEEVDIFGKDFDKKYEIKSVELEKLPSKTEYKLGVDKNIDLSGGLVEIVYKDKDKNGLEYLNVVKLFNDEGKINEDYFKVVDESAFKYAVENGICATCPITIKLNKDSEKTITFNVKTVDKIAKKVTLLDSTKQYLQKEYLAGESLNTDKLTFVVWYDDYTQEYFTEGQEKEVTKLVLNDKGEWEEKVETETVKIDDYFVIYTRQYLRETGELEAESVNMRYDRISDDFVVNTGTFTIPGQNELAKVYYKLNMNAEALTIENINVIGIKQAEVKEASLNRTTYVIGEKVDLEGGKLIVEYYNGETKEVDLTNPEVSFIGIDLSHAGKDWTNPHMEFVNRVGVVYGGTITTLDLTVIHPEQIEKIEVTENPRDYYNMGDNIDRSMGALNVTWINWKRYNGEYDDNNDKFIVGDYQEGESADKKSGIFTYRVPFDSNFLSEEDEPIRLSTDDKNYNIISAVNTKDEEGNDVKAFPKVVKVEYAKHLAGDSIVVEDKDSVLAKMTTEYPINVEDTITDRIEVDVEHSKINYLLGVEVQNSDFKVYKVSKFGEKVLLDPNEYTLDEETTDMSSVGEHIIKVYYSESVKCYTGTQFEEIVINGRNEKPYEDEVKVNVYTKEQSYTFLLTDEELEAFLNNAVDDEPVVEVEKISAIQKLTDEELEKYIEQAEKNSDVYEALITEKKIRDEAKKEAQEKLDVKIAKVKASVLSIENVDGKNEVKILRDKDRLTLKVRKPENEEKYREYDELDVSRYQLEFYYKAEGNEYNTRVLSIPLTDKMIMNAEEQELYGLKSLKCSTGTKKGTEENEVIRVYKFAEARAERTDKIGIIYSLDGIVTKHEENPEEIDLRKLQPGYKEPEEKDKKPVLGEDYLYTSLDAIVMDCIVDSIKVTKSPKKDKYLIGEEFNPEGMIVTAYNKAKEAIRDLKYIEADEENKIEEQKEYTIVPTIMSGKITEVTIIFKNRLGTQKTCKVNILANNYEGEEPGIRIYYDNEVIKIRITEDEFTNNNIEEKLAEQLISKNIVTKQVEVEPKETTSEEVKDVTAEETQEEPKEMKEVPTGELDLILVKDKVEIKVIQPEETINYFVDGSIQTEKYKLEVTYVETEKTEEKDAEPKVIQKVKLGEIPLSKEMLKEQYVFTKAQIDKEVEIEVNYYDATDKFTVKVNDNEIKKIEVSKEPNKKSYELKDFDDLAKLDLTGMVVKGYNINGLCVKDLTTDEYYYEPVQIGIGEGHKNIYTIEIIYKNKQDSTSEEAKQTEKISAKIDGFEVWIIDDVIKVQIPKEDYEKVKDKIAQKVTSAEEKDGIVDLHLAPGELTISVTKPENDADYDVGTKLDLTRYKVNLNYKSGNVDVDLLQVALTEDMLEDDLEEFTMEQAGTEVEFAVNYLDLDTTFKVKVSKKQGHFNLGELKTVIFEGIEYIRIENRKMTVQDLKDIIKAANSEEVVIEVFDTENELAIDTDKLETAMKVRISKGSEIAEYGIAKVGFTNDIDNEITGSDILKLLIHVAEDGAKSPNKEKLLTGAYLAAADINGDGKVDFSDILPFMKLHNEAIND